MAPLAFEEAVAGAEVVPEVAGLLVPVVVVTPGAVVVAAWVTGVDVVTVTTAEVEAAPVPDPVEEAPPELEGFFPTQLVSEPGRTLKGAES
jgi:hypothetical protein